MWLVICCLLELSSFAQGHLVHHAGGGGGGPSPGSFAGGVDSNSWLYSDSGGGMAKPGEAPQALLQQQASNEKTLQEIKEIENRVQALKHTPDPTLSSGQPWDRKWIMKQLGPSMDKRKIDLNTIPDVPIDYEFQSPQGVFRDGIERLYQNLFKIQPEYSKQKIAKEMGLLTVVESDRFYSLGDEESAYSLRQASIDFLDIAVGYDPITGLGRNTYELLTGKNLITGVDLNLTERSIAVVGILSLGTNNATIKLAQMCVRLSKWTMNLNAITTSVSHGVRIYNSSVGKLLQIRFLNKASHIHNPLPKDGVYARLVSRQTAELIIEGKTTLSKNAEAFVAARADLADVVHDPILLAKKLHLYTDAAETQLKYLTNDHVLVTFSMKKMKQVKVNDLTKYNGFISGGKTKGGAREWIIPSDALQQKMIDRGSLKIEELFK